MSGLFGGTGVENNKSSESTSNNITTQTDNRIVAGDGALVIGPDGSYSTSNDMVLDVNATTSTANSNNTAWNWSSTQSTDNHSNFSNSVSTDSHDSYQLTDSGAIAAAQAINAQNTQFLGVAAESNADSLRLVAQMSTDQLAAMGDDMVSLANTNRQAWESTLTASQGLIGQMLAQAAATTSSARDIAQTAINSFQPTDNKNADTIKYIAVGLAVYLAYKAMK